MGHARGGSKQEAPDHRRPWQLPLWLRSLSERECEGVVVFFVVVDIVLVAQLLLELTILTPLSINTQESLVRFIGRALCCRAGVPPPPTAAANPYALITDAPKAADRPTWRIEDLPDNSHGLCCVSCVSCVVFRVF